MRFLLSLLYPQRLLSMFSPTGQPVEGAVANRKVALSGLSADGAQSRCKHLLGASPVENTRSMPSSLVAGTLRAAAAVAERQLQRPHGGTLVDLMAPVDEHPALKASAARTVQLSDRNACDVELLTVGCVSW